MFLQGLMYRGRFVAAANAEGADPALKTQAEAVAKIGRGGDPLDRYKAMIKGMAMLNLGGWDEAREVATVFDTRVPATLYQLGDRIPVQVAPVYEFQKHLSRHYMVYITLLRSNGDGVSKARPRHFYELEATQMPSCPSPAPAPSTEPPKTSAWTSNTSSSPASNTSPSSTTS